MIMEIKKGPEGPRTKGNSRVVNYNAVKKLMSTLMSSDEPVTRAELAQRLGTDDRTAREIVTFARLMGWPVCSRSDRSGYWLGTEADTERMIAEYRSRARALEDVAEALEDTLREGRQMELEMVMEVSA